jgi:hypothetical protein
MCVVFPSCPAITVHQQHNAAPLLLDIGLDSPGVPHPGKPKPIPKASHLIRVFSQALHFYLDASEQRCFLEELPSDTIVEGKSTVIGCDAKGWEA